jgi:hypothetical protein
MTATATLCCHRGASAVERSRIIECQTPVGSATWQPIPHETLIASAASAIEAAGLTITDEQHAITRNEDRYFGVLNLAPAVGGPEDFTFAVGLRNSHDKSMQAGIALGTLVFVCDNLAFSGEVQVGRRHSGRILEVLPGLLAGAVAKIMAGSAQMVARVDAYKGRRLHDVKAHDLILRAVDERVISNARIAAVVKEWRQPSHPEFAARTAWSLFNAFTEVLKATPAVTLQPRTARLHRLFDDFAHVAG